MLVKFSPKYHFASNRFLSLRVQRLLPFISFGSLHGFMNLHHNVLSVDVCVQMALGEVDPPISSFASEQKE
ncbi:hypothetical protein Agabi119p4_10600 [Agaricus bisporus var. burnettii]|uniref:Uncharacterized protein n=1 Tax=Agaricus bisporus var. burnettii TaxID=192524 RepID=A0A8H7C2J1_AGABI|nr:hypothetical protein Agabi119p4_10600 [Agaricus bisporus var. burnettii]